MGDKSPKSKARGKKQEDARKATEQAARDKKQAPPAPPAKKGK